MILAGDVGGTKVNLAAFTVGDGGLTCGVEGTFSSRDHSSLTGIAREFLAAHRLKAEYACFGIAGPVREQRVEVTNLPWVIDARELRGSLGLKQVWLINDLEANASGIEGLGPGDLVELNRGDAGAGGNRAILAAGTGLGEAGLFWDGTRHRPMASEGGHADFAPRTDLDVELLRFLRARLGQVSWENVLSGPGLWNIYQFLRDTGRGTERGWLGEEFGKVDPPVAITRAGLERRCGLCAQALDLFVSCYGAEAGNLGLKMLATGGVYVGGGIAPKIIGKLRDGAFMKAFIGEGRMKDLLGAMPVRVIMNDKTALIGAARHAAFQGGGKHV